MINVDNTEATNVVVGIAWFAVFVSTFRNQMTPGCIIVTFRAARIMLSFPFCFVNHLTDCCANGCVQIRCFGRYHMIKRGPDCYQQEQEKSHYFEAILAFYALSFQISMHHRLASFFSLAFFPKAGVLDTFQTSDWNLFIFLSSTVHHENIRKWTMGTRPVSVWCSLKLAAKTLVARFARSGKLCCFSFFLTLERWLFLESLSGLQIPHPCSNWLILLRCSAF